MAKYQRRLGHLVRVITREGFDSYGMRSFYGEENLMSVAPITRGKGLLKRLLSLKRSMSFYIKVVLEARDFDVVHIHSVFLTYFVLPFKTRIVEFHGTDIRRGEMSKDSRLRRHIKRRLLSILNSSTKFYVSTPDLLNEYPNTEWIPNPVDDDHFTPRDIEPDKMRRRAIYFKNWYESPDRAIKLAFEKKWDLMVVDRTSEDTIPHKDFPRFLSQFEYLIDRHRIPSLSKSALEFLSLGLEVVDWKGNIVKGLPSIHRPENVAKNTVDIYERALN